MHVLPHKKFSRTDFNFHF